MKKSTPFYLIACILVLTTIIQSCMKYDETPDIHIPNALVTAKTATDSTFFLQLNDAITLLPINVRRSPFGGKEVRALVSYVETDQFSKDYTKVVHVNWIDSIRTKGTASSFGDKNDSIYGTDPVDIVNDWVTIAEDNYLTLRFRTWWPQSDKPHLVNLVHGVNSDNPYEVHFHHNAQVFNPIGNYGDALIAFSLDSLPDTKGQTVKLKLVWHTQNGPRSTEFNYCSRQATNGQLLDENKIESFNTVE